MCGILVLNGALCSPTLLFQLSSPLHSAPCHSTFLLHQPLRHVRWSGNESYPKLTKESIGVYFWTFCVCKWSKNHVNNFFILSSLASLCVLWFFAVLWTISVVNTKGTNNCGEFFHKRAWKCYWGLEISNWHARSVLAIVFWIVIDCKSSDPCANLARISWLVTRHNRQGSLVLMTYVFRVCMLHFIMVRSLCKNCVAWFLSGISTRLCKGCAKKICGQQNRKKQPYLPVNYHKKHEQFVAHIQPKSPKHGRKKMEKGRAAVPCQGHWSCSLAACCINVFILSFRVHEWFHRSAPLGQLGRDWVVNAEIWYVKWTYWEVVQQHNTVKWGMFFL